AKGAKIAHILRDFIADCQQDQFNISEQEIDSYRLDCKRLTAQIIGPPGRRWVACKIRVAERYLMDGLCDLVELPNIRYSLIVAILAAKYQTYLHQLRANRFVLTPQLSFRWHRFMSKILANLRLTLLMRKRRLHESAATGDIRTIVPAS